MSRCRERVNRNFEVIFLPYSEGPWAASDGFVSEHCEFKGEAVKRARELVRDSLAEEAEVVRTKGRSLVMKVGEGEESS